MSKKNKGDLKGNSLQKVVSTYTGKVLSNKDNTDNLTPKYTTGIKPVDDLLNGGLPMGHIVGFGAEYGVGKTTLLLQICGNIIKKYRKKVYYINVEGGATYDLISALNLNHLLYFQEDNPNGLLYLLEAETIQDISKIVKHVSKDLSTSIIVIDSATQVIDQKVLDDPCLGANDKSFGSDARMWSHAGKYLTATIKETNACIVLINQTRIDFHGKHPVLVPAGGKSLRFIPSVELWGKRKSYLTDDYTETKVKENSGGILMELTTTKNRFALPYKKTLIPLMFGKGVSEAYLIKTWLEEHGPILKGNKSEPTYLSRKSSWFEFKIPELKMSKKVQGTTEVWEFILRNSTAIKELMNNHI